MQLFLKSNNDIKFDELMIDRSPKKSDKEVLSELERQLPNLPLGKVIEFHEKSKSYVGIHLKKMVLGYKISKNSTS